MNEQMGSSTNQRFGNATNTGYVGGEYVGGETELRAEPATIQEKLSRTFELLGRINEKIFFPTPEKDMASTPNENKMNVLLTDINAINHNLEKIDSALSLLGK